MSIRDFKTNAKAAMAGVPVPVGTPNEDGTQPVFYLSRMTSQNKKYAELNAATFKPYQRQMAMGTLSQEKRDELTLDVFCKAILMGWEHVQPNDAGLKDELAFSIEAAKKLLKDPDYFDLYVKLLSEAMDEDNYRAEENEEIAKN